MKLKPLTTGQKTVLQRLANVLVCQMIENDVIKPTVEKITGQPYDDSAKDSFVNQFLSSNPEYKQVWKYLQKEIGVVQRDQLANLKAKKRNER